MADLPSRGDQDIRIRGPVETGNYRAGVNSENRLLVDALTHPGGFPGDLGKIFQGFLEYSGSSDMSVNGSSTPVVFTVDADVTEDIYVNSIILNLGDNANMNITGFGGIVGGITNGCVFEIRSNSTTYTINTYKQNSDLAVNFDFFEINNSAQYLQAVFYFSMPFKLYKNTGDFIKMTINDNLTFLTSFQMYVRGWKE